MSEAKKCPHCHRPYLKDDNCNYVFSCGLTENGFQINLGCGRSFCHLCSKKFCSQQYDPTTGVKLATYKDSHDANCCRTTLDFKLEDYCQGGHNSHCDKRW